MVIDLRIRPWFLTTVAEPALNAITRKAAEVAAQGEIIASGESAQASYALGLRLTVAVSVGLAIAVGIIRILRGWPVHYLIITGYMIVVLMTLIAPDVTDHIVDAAKAIGATGSTIIPSHGSGIHDAKKLFGLTLEAQTDLVSFSLEKHRVEKVMKAFNATGRFDEPGNGTVGLYIQKML